MSVDLFGTGGQGLQSLTNNNMKECAEKYTPPSFNLMQYIKYIESSHTIAAVRLGTNADAGKFAPMAAIGPFCACPSRLCMSLGRLAVEPTAWFLRTSIASSSLSRRSSIRDWEDQRDWRVKGWGEGKESRRGTEQLSISTLGQKLKTLIAWCGLETKKKQITYET